MPEKFYMNKGDKVTYHMIYEVPEDTAGLMLLYTEFDETDVDSTFTININ